MLTYCSLLFNNLFITGLFILYVCNMYVYVLLCRCTDPARTTMSSTTRSTSAASLSVGPWKVCCVAYTSLVW